MNIQSVVYPYNETLLCHIKEQSTETFYNKDELWVNMRNLCQAKEARYKRPGIVWFSLHEISI